MGESHSFRSDPAGESSNNDLGRELKLLHDQQHAAIRQAIYLGMTLEEEDAFDIRSVRIQEILRIIGRG
jgi:hypothetical protein